MKPYMFNYSEELEMISPSVSMTVYDSTVRTFAIENDDCSSLNYDSTVSTESIENDDAEKFLFDSTILTNVVENDDQSILSFSTSETRMLESSDSDGVHIYCDSTMFTKTFEQIDADEIGPDY